MNDHITSASDMGASLFPFVRSSSALHALPPVSDPDYVHGLVVGASVGVLNSPLVTLPPVSNTGGKSEGGALGGNLDDLDFAWESGEPARIDTLTFSFAGIRFGGDVHAVRQWVRRWSDGLLTIGGNVQRYNGYRQCLQVVLASGAESPMLGWLGVSDGSDPMKGRWCLHLTGAACGFLSSGHWSRLFDDLPVYEVAITRVDLAVDELSGEHSVDYMRQQYFEGAFNLNGRPPKFQFIQSSDGNTFYVGKRGSGKLCRSYEKGRQLGNNESSWVRHEVELRNSSRVIPLDVLVNPTSYFKGAYLKAFSWVSGGSSIIKTFRAKHKIVFDNAVIFAKRQVGRLVRYCRDVIGYAPDQIVEELIADPGRYPSRLFDVDNDLIDLAWG